MLTLELRLLTGRYVATSYNDRAGAEWPPHPARLYSALVATHFASEEQDSAERRALEWLEEQGPPSVRASDAAHREVVTVFVPVNDTTVIGSFDKEQERLAKAQAVLMDLRCHLDAATDDKQKRKLQKDLTKAVRQLDKAQKKLGDVILSRIKAPAKVGKGDAACAEALLPGWRGRQPRTFPSVTPDDPVVTYSWPEADPGEHGPIVDRLAARVVRVGHSSSLVALRVAPTSGAASYVPVESGPHRLRVVRKGQLRSLEAAFERHRETEPRVLPKTFQDYASAVAKQTSLPSPVFGTDWLVLEWRRGAKLAATRGPDVALAVRGALLKHAGEPIAEVLSGHQRDGSPSERPHLAIVPLPFVGRMHADGLLKGVALVVPRDGSTEEKKAVYLALSRWEEAARNRGSEDDAPDLRLMLGTGGTVGLGRVDQLSRLHTLRPRSWCVAAHSWATVAPVALDRNPGDLHSRNVKKLEAAIRAAEESIRASCFNVGLPPPLRVDVLPFAPLAAVYKARRFGPFPRDPKKTQRVLTHAFVQFAEPVLGPVLLGAGRYLGLGLFKPVDNDD